MTLALKIVDDEDEFVGCWPCWVSGSRSTASGHQQFSAWMDLNIICNHGASPQIKSVCNPMFELVHLLLGLAEAGQWLVLVLPVVGN
ncbi:unnamed protein product [Camellia sinensis]